MADYEWRSGRINWDGVEMNAVVIVRLTLEDEDSFVPQALATKILGDNLDISAAPARWAVFAKPYNFRPGWRLLGCGSGTQGLPAPSGNVPDKVIRQLEEIFPA